MLVSIKVGLLKCEGRILCNYSTIPLRGAISIAKIETGTRDGVQDPTSTLRNIDKIAYAQDLQSDS